MSTEISVASKQPAEDSILPQRKKIRTSDLPLNAAQRSSIDSLLHTIKKKGEFDSLRKLVWSRYTESVSPIGIHGENLLRISLNVITGC